MANQAKHRLFNNAPKFKYGFEVASRDYKHAIWLYKRNGNSKWVEATQLEMAPLNNDSTLNDVGKYISDGFKKTRIHLVYDVKHNGWYKARLVADGHLTDIPLERVYSDVVSLCGIGLLTFTSELNGLDLWATDSYRQCLHRGEGLYCSRPQIWEY